MTSGDAGPAPSGFWLWCGRDHGGQGRPAAPDRRAERAGARIDLDLDLALTGGRREGLVAEDRDLQAGVVGAADQDLAGERVLARHECVDDLLEVLGGHHADVALEPRAVDVV